MRNSPIQLRTAANAPKALIFAALILPLGIASVPALAQGIQMLPPVTEGTKTDTIATTGSAPTPCPGPPKGTPAVPNILTWDGKNPITCATGITVTGGNVGIGTASPIGNLDVEPSPVQAATAPPTPATICLNGTCSTTHGFGSYVQEYGTAAETVKEPCGFTSVAYCPSGYTAISGGMTNGGNDELQNSQPVFDASGKPNGWGISVADANGGGFCTLNTISPYGGGGSPPPTPATASGTAPNLFFTNGTNTIYGDAVVLCGQD